MNHVRFILILKNNFINVSNNISWGALPFQIKKIDYVTKFIVLKIP